MAHKITISLEKQDAAILAVMCKRAFRERVEPFAGSDAETDQMLESLKNLENELRKHGYDPR